MDLTACFNLIEAGLWGLFALICLLSALRRGNERWQPMLLSVTFGVFGVSDLIEVQTGAWWRPWWLLVMKAVCLLVLICIGVPWLRSVRNVSAMRRGDKRIP